MEAWTWTWVEKSDGMDIWICRDARGNNVFNVTRPDPNGARIPPQGESSLHQIREARMEAVWMALGDQDGNYTARRSSKLDRATRRRIIGSCRWCC